MDSSSTAASVSHRGFVEQATPQSSTSASTQPQSATASGPLADLFTESSARATSAQPSMMTTPINSVQQESVTQNASTGDASATIFRARSRTTVTNRYNQSARYRI